MTQPNALNAVTSMHAKRLTKDFLTEISADHYQQPRLSLYQPTHRHHPENQQDPIHQTVASYGGVGAGSGAMHHGHGGKSDEVYSDADRFFRAVDRGVLETHSRPSGLPLILAALPEHHHLFHAVSHNPSLVSEGIRFHPQSISIEELRKCAWKIFEPLYQARLEALGNDFAVAKSKGLGLDNLALIGEAAAAGRVATLLVEADREIVGQIHDGSGNLHLGTSDHTQSDELLDDLGERVLKMGGQVFVIPASQMPTDTGAAATCRY